MHWNCYNIIHKDIVVTKISIFSIKGLDKSMQLTIIWTDDDHFNWTNVCVTWMQIVKNNFRTLQIIIWECKSCSNKLLWNHNCICIFKYFMPFCRVGSSFNRTPRYIQHCNYWEWTWITTAAQKNTHYTSPSWVYYGIYCEYFGGKWCWDMEVWL